MKLSISIKKVIFKILIFTSFFLFGISFPSLVEATCVDQNYKLICRTDSPPYEDCVYTGTLKPCRGPDAATDKCECKTVTTPPKEREGIQFREIINQAMPEFKFKDATIGGILSALLPYLFVLAGLMLFVYLILGGFQLMTSGGDPKAMEAAKGKITNAVVGFIIVFVSYWLVQILQVILGLPKIFGDM